MPTPKFILPSVSSGKVRPAFIRSKFFLEMLITSPYSYLLPPTLSMKVTFVTVAIRTLLCLAIVRKLILFCQWFALLFQSETVYYQPIVSGPI